MVWKGSEQALARSDRTHPASSAGMAGGLVCATTLQGDICVPIGVRVEYAVRSLLQRYRFALSALTSNALLVLLSSRKLAANSAGTLV